MKLTQHYNKLWENAVVPFRQGLVETDPLLTSTTDSRFGITVLVRPQKQVLQRMEQLLQELRLLEPEQYFYPASDIHITVMSVIACYAGFTLEAIQPEAYLQLLQDIAGSINAFDIHFRGLTASPSCVMVQGFPGSDSLEALREQIRLRVKEAGLQQSMDTRYTIQTAHCTVLRFKTGLKNPEAFVDTLEKYRDFDFGASSVKQVELVYNDWYQRREHVRQLGVFPLA